MGRGGACVPARVAPQGRIHRYPRAQCVYFWHGNAAARTFGRAHRHRPLCILLGWIARGQLMSFGQIVCKWLFCLCGIAWENMMEMGRGGACVPARVAPQGRIRRSIPRAQCVYFWYRNAAARTFGRAHRRCPYGFVWVDYTWTVDVVWANCA